MAAQDAENEFFLALLNQTFARMNVPPTPDEEIINSIEKFVTYFREHRRAAGACSPAQFQTNADFLGYFYWHSPISSAVTRCKALEAFRNIPAFGSRFNQDQVNVVSVGGGSGSDLVGLYSALPATAAFRSMNVTLIDNVDWRQYFEEIHRSLREGAFGNASQLIGSRDTGTSFILADVTSEPLTPECKGVIRGADVVWMKGFLSALATDFVRSHVTRRIIKLMAPGALLVIIDSPAYDQFNDFAESLETASQRQLDNRDNLPKRLVRLYNTEGAYELELNAAPQYRIIKTTNHEMIIFQKI